MNMEYQEGKLRVGFIGLGGRGQGILDLILDMDDIEVSAVCDCYEDRAQKGVEIYLPCGEKRGNLQPLFLFGGKNLHTGGADKPASAAASPS